MISLRCDYRLTDIAHGVVFDIDADGIAEQVAWPDRSSALAMLTMDRNGNGRIDDGSELFGNVTVLPNGARAANGFEALAAIDTNSDGFVDAQDPAWMALRLWFDVDHDGQSSESELVPVSFSDVVAFRTAYRWVGRRDRNGNLFRYQSEVVFTNGVRRYYDVFLLK